MKLLVVLALVACAPPSSPAQPVSPLPPDHPIPVDAETTSEAPAAPFVKVPIDQIVWPAFPAIADAPTSHPTGAPITVPPAPVPKANDKHNRVVANTFEQHSVIDNKTSRYQLTKTTFDLDIKVLAVASGHSTELEVDANKANEWVALAGAPTDKPRQDMPLLRGTYHVFSDTGRDGVRVERGPGEKVYSRESEELGGLFAGELSGPDTTLAFLRDKKLRLGEVQLLDDKDKKVLGGDKITGTVQLSLTKADATQATYQMDVTATTPGMFTKGEIHVRMQAVIVFERKTGRLLSTTTVTHKLEEDPSNKDDSFASESTTYVWN